MRHDNEKLASAPYASHAPHEAWEADVIRRGSRHFDGIVGANASFEFPSP